MAGMFSTSDGATGMMPWAEMGTELLTGHRLCRTINISQSATHSLSKRYSPGDIRAARIEDQVEATLTVCEHSNVHHQTLVVEVGVACQMEDDSHIVLVVRGIEAVEINGAASHALSKVLRV
jgi:hypothetical protein